MLLANHGILTTGQTVAQAFDELYYFEKACETYITALSTSKELKIVTPEIAEKTFRKVLFSLLLVLGVYLLVVKLSHYANHI